MGALNHPTARFLAHISLQFLRLFSPRPDMEGEAELLCEGDDLVAHISGIQAKILFSACRWTWPPNGDRFDGCARQLHIMAVGTVNDDAKWNPFRVSEHAALGTTLGSVDGTWPCFFPRPMAPWSWRRPWQAMTSQSPSPCHT